MIKQVVRIIALSLCIYGISSCKKCANIKGTLPDINASSLKLKGNFTGYNASSLKMVNDSTAYLEYTVNKKKYTFIYKVKNNGTYKNTVLRKP